MKRHPIFPLLGAMCLCYGVSFIGWLGTKLGLAGWYLTLEMPAWQPPVWLFAPVWTVLYGLMSVAIYRIYESESPNRSVAMVVFGVQLFLNGLWPWLFFAGHFLFASTVEIMALFIAICLTIVLSLRVSKTAGLILIPYMLWVVFAACLNFQIWRLNPTGGGIKTVPMAVGDAPTPKPSP